MPMTVTKTILYLMIFIANAVIFQNVVDIIMVLWQLIREDCRFSRENLVMLSPYVIRE